MLMGAATQLWLTAEARSMLFLQPNSLVQTTSYTAKCHG